MPARASRPLSKSYLPGKGWVKAADLKPQQRRAIKYGIENGYGHKGMIGRVTPEHEAYRAAIKEGHAYLEGRTSRPAKVGKWPVEHYVVPKADIEGHGAAAMQLGGRKGRRIMVTHDQPTPLHLKHEAGHLTPNRSSYRFYQMHPVNHPIRNSREEARADMTAGSFWRTAGDHSNHVGPYSSDPTHSGYAKKAADSRWTDEKTQAFRDTQDRIAGSRRKVRKSFIPGVGYKPASAMPKRQLRALANGGRAQLSAQIKAHEAEHSANWRQANDAIRGLHEHMASPPGFLDLHHPQNLGPMKSGRNTVDRFKFGVLNPHAQELMGDAAATAHAHGGRRGGKFMALRWDAPDHVVAHEAAHLGTKRSAYRQHTMTPIQVAREEARADMASGHPSGHYKSPRKVIAGDGSAYTMAAKHPAARLLARATTKDPMYSREGMKAYRQVQDNIAASRARRQQVGKSFQPWDGIHSEVSKYYNETRPATVEEMAMYRAKHKLGAIFRPKKYASGVTTSDDEGNRFVDLQPTGLPTKNVKRFSGIVGGEKKRTDGAWVAKSFTGAAYKPVTAMTKGERAAVRRRISTANASREIASTSGKRFNHKGQITQLHTSYWPEMRHMNEVMSHLKRNDAQFARVPSSGRGRPSGHGSTRPARVNDLWHRHTDIIGKSFQPWDGVHSEVSKMGPDASEVHVMGGISRQTKQRKKARFTRITTQ